MEKPKKVLIITTSGGAGHIQAAKAISQDLLLKDKNTIIIQKEIFLSWGFKRICKFGIHTYDKIQKVGSKNSKEKIVQMQSYADIFFWPKFVFHIYLFLKKHNFDRIIDTQPVGTSAVIKAIRLYNFKKNKNLILEKIIVDLPTKRTTHFFKNIKRLSKEDKKFLKIYSIEPLLEDEKNDEEFWQKNCGVSLDKVIYEKYFIRSAFKNFQNKIIDDSLIEIKVKTNNPKEENLLSKILPLTNSKILKKEDHFIFPIEKNDFCITILLGSQPALLATEKYFDNLVEYVKKIEKSSTAFYLFIFLSNEYKLFEKIFEKLKNFKDFPKNLKIIPMSYQEDTTIAPLFFRSNVTITRSGGSTILELLAVARGKTLIHSEEKEKDLIKGIPFWEAGNYLYLKNFKNAELVNVDNFTNYFSI
ncbi:MAG: hypothetical protein JXA94_02205 [Parachlamydiales bacterium]|nr:hypothetical protein [Parachlamydiales bacterium]